MERLTNHITTFVIGISLLICADPTIAQSGSEIYRQQRMAHFKARAIGQWINQYMTDSIVANRLIDYIEANRVAIRNEIDRNSLSEGYFVRASAYRAANGGIWVQIDPLGAASTHYDALYRYATTDRIAQDVPQGLRYDWRLSRTAIVTKYSDDDSVNVGYFPEALAHQELHQIRDVLAEERGQREYNSDRATSEHDEVGPEYEPESTWTGPEPDYYYNDQECMCEEPDFLDQFSGPMSRIDPDRELREMLEENN